MESKKRQGEKNEGGENPVQSLRQALRYLEQEAKRMGLQDVAHFIGCGRMAIDERTSVTPQARPHTHLC
jgi:hypothetical protein